jgi:hypothetical protein
MATQRDISERMKLILGNSGSTKRKEQFFQQFLQEMNILGSYLK